MAKEAENDQIDNPNAIFSYSAFSSLESLVALHEPVGDINPGLYSYHSVNHGLIPLKMGVFRKEIVEMCIGQAQPYKAHFGIILVACFERYMKRYRHARAYRNLLVNAGELAQKYLLLATTYRLSQFITPAFNDKKAEKFTGLDGVREGPVYALYFG